MTAPPNPPRPEDGQPEQPKSGPGRKSLAWTILAMVAFVTVMLAFSFIHPSAGSTSITYTRFVQQADAHQVRSVSVSTNGSAKGEFTNGKAFSTVIPLQLAGPPLLSQLRRDAVTVSATSPTSSAWSGLLSWLLILGPVIFLLWWFSRIGRRGGLAGGALGVGKSRAKVFDAERPVTRFGDIAGYDGVKAEVSEVVSFLREPERYRRAGAVAPRGVLMVGPPGTGKTLMARAVAGEAGVPFLSVTGSSFVEMYVGVGAARVRDLFEEARKRAPSIIFVDEIDALGQRRSGTGGLVANDEREQTLNQLLAEMDGFDPSEGVVVLAATNRPDVLDVALLRPGRFDRQVTIPLPNQQERLAILGVHCKGKTIDTSVDLELISRATPGFSGADLANLANEAAINAARDDRTVLTRDDFDQARDRVLLGRRDGSTVLLAEEKHAVAVHESGHALVAALLPNADPVEKVTILPAGQALGVTQQLPLVERHLYSESYLLDTLAVQLGGRAAELVELGEASSGAANDLEHATEVATKMVREFGLSSRIGPVGYPMGGSVFLGSQGSGWSSRPFAEQTQAAIDGEVARLLTEAEARATELLRSHRVHLHRLAELLVEHETIDGSVIDDLLTGLAAKSTAPRHDHEIPELQVSPGQRVSRPCSCGTSDLRPGAQWPYRG